MKRIAIHLVALATVFSSVNASRAQDCRSPQIAAPCGKPICTCRTQTLRPVAQTRLRPRQVVTHRDVPTIQYQQQPVVEQVPVVQRQNVTVDAGQYQMVWVPKLVTQQVARTVYVPRTTYRTVSRVVNRRVAQVQTQYVPEQTVSYVPQTTQFTFQPAAAPVFAQMPTQHLPTQQLPMSTFVPAAPCVNSPTAAFAYPTTAMQPTQFPALTNPAPVTASVAPLTASVPRLALDRFRPTPVPAASRLGMRTHETVDEFEIELPRFNASASARNRFVPAPSAATVWRSSMIRR